MLSQLVRILLYYFCNSSRPANLLAQVHESAIGLRCLPSRRSHPF